MEQLRHIGEVLGSLKVLMAFQDEIQINRRQCCLLVDAYNMAFEQIVEEIRHNLRFEEKHTKWSALENPLRELHRIMKEGQLYIKQCLEPKDDWWAKAISLNQNVDCVGFHLHNLLSCISVVFEAIENVGEISGCDNEEINKKRLILSKKYKREWMDAKLFQITFGKKYLVSEDMRSRMDGAIKEDRWKLSEAISDRRNSPTTPLTKHENQLAELLLAPRGKLFPISVLVGSKEYQVRRRLGSGMQYKEIQWLGESFAVRHFFGDIESLSQEISFLSSLSHPHVMHYMYAFSDEERKECFLVMELMNKDLASYLKEICCPRRRVPFPLIVAVDIMLQIARGMEYLHSQKIYHGDLNPANILVRARNSSQDGYLHVKVAGFGLSTVKNSKGSSNYPCIWYAPEVLKEQEQTVESVSKYSDKADIYSFAMISFELLTGKIPFEDDHLQGDKMSRNIRAGERPLFPFPCQKYLTSLTKRCWQADPTQRPSFSSICRVLRYIKRFLIIDHNPPNLPCPAVDYFEIDMSLSKKFVTCSGMETLKVLDIPIQMFAYRVMEKEKTSVNLKEKSSESGSDETSNYEDESGFNTMIPEETFAPPLPFRRSPSQPSYENYNKASPRKMDGSIGKQSGNL